MSATTAFDADKHTITLQGKEFTLFPGLVALAYDQSMVGMTTRKLQDPAEDNGYRAIFEATSSFLVYDADGEIVRDGNGDPLIAKYTCQGDASPKDVKANMIPVLLRMAETRAMARSLRVGTGLATTAYDELGPDAH